MMIAFQPCRLCSRGMLHKVTSSQLSVLPPRGRSLLTSSSIASTSKITLSRLTLSRPAARSAQAMRYSAPTAPLRQSSRRSLVFGPPDQSRGMATLTRQPESPEEPEVFSGGAAPGIILTDRAIKHLAKVSAKENNPNLALRVAVEPGGCHGYQYKMEMTNEIEDDDFRFSSGDNVHLLVDSTSLHLIKGSTIDYVTELIGSQFAILNNPQAKGAGCGCGVSWEPII